MSCVEKRHMSHRVGGMLHHRFPNGFTDLSMDETDREVSTLTDRAFRSLCVGDDAVYNDDLLYGYSPFNCHKPLASEPPKKTQHKDSKKHGQSKNDKHDAQPWKQQQKKNISQMSSFLKALSATEESCEGMLIKNGGMADSNGESWDKSALRSIQRELSEFSTDYQTSLTDRHYKNQLRHQSGNGSSNKAGKDLGLPSGKSTKSKNGKTNIKLRKLNIKNFFLHSEFSPFQTWTDLNRFPFGQEDPVSPILPTDNIPKWCDLPFYKELTEAHRKETLEKEDSQQCQKEAAQPSPPAPLRPPVLQPSPPPPPPPSVPSAPKPTPLPPPPKVLPKPSATPAEKRCTSEVGDGTAAPWRRNRSRATSAVPGNQPVTSLQENISKTLNESLLLVKKEAKSVEVKAVEEVSSLSSTPFSICQLMTPLIPSRQPTETSEILQGVLTPLALDLSLRPHSEAKVTPEPPIKRDSYKALASSILFNLKDNRKRVKSRYSPPKFKTLELPESASQSPQSDHLKPAQAGYEGNASGLSTPAMLRDGLPVFSPIVEPVASPDAGFAKPDEDTPLSDDYLLSHLLQTKREAAGSGGLGEENPISPFIHSKNKSATVKKLNYPSLNLYKKANPAESDTPYLQVPPSFGSPALKHPTPDNINQVSPFTLNKELPTSSGVSPNTLNVITDSSSATSPQKIHKEGQMRPQNVPEETKRQAKEAKGKDFGVQSPAKEGREASGQMSTMDVIRAAKEAINAAKNKARSTAYSDGINKPVSDTKELEKASKEVFSSRGEAAWDEDRGNNGSSQDKSESTLSGRTSNVKKEPPPVPKRNFAKSDIQFTLEKQQIQADRVSNGDNEDAKIVLLQKDSKSEQKNSKHKHLFSARQNNYIKNQRYAEAGDVGEDKEGNLNVNTEVETDHEVKSQKEVKDSEHIINDLHALKTLQRAKLGDRVLENARKKLTTLNIDEEAKAKNDLISRELRNIKKGMLSMRENTTSKRELLMKKEEQSKHEGFMKLDSNVIVNKALINDNYDKAKMALEEIISERERRKNQSIEEEANANLNESGNESYAPKTQQVTKDDIDYTTEIREKQDVSASSSKEKDVRDRLVDLRDHNHLRQILSQTEPRGGETHRSGGWGALPGTELDSRFTGKAKYDNSSYVTENSEVNARPEKISTESGEYSKSESESQQATVPAVPPRSKKGGRRSAESLNTENYPVVSNENAKYRNYEAGSNELWSSSTNPEANNNKVASQSKTTSHQEKWNSVNRLNSDSEADLTVSESGLTSNLTQPEGTPCLSPEIGASENRAHTYKIYSPASEASSENSSTKAQETCKKKRKAPLRPDHLALPDSHLTSPVVEEEPTTSSKGTEDTESEGLSETPSVVSPLLLVNGLSINQSPPDLASLSSKSSYFSVESALQRNAETESNVYHSLENLIREMEQVDEAARNSSQSKKRDADRTDLEYYSLSDHESDTEVLRGFVQSPKTEQEILPQDGNNREDGSQDENASTTSSLSNTFSPTLGIPALFKVKDNTFTNKQKKTLPAWSPRGSLSGTEKVEEHQESHEVKENPEVLLNDNLISAIPSVLPEIIEPEESFLNPFPPLLQISLNPQNLQKPNVGNLLTVPPEEDRFSGVSPLSEGVESLTTSAADMADEMATTAGGLEESELPNVERPGSTCSGNDSQTGLPKPPAVLPKSEKAVLKAIKLANRRMKKEEGQKSSQKSSHSSSKQRADKHKGEKSDPKSSSRSSRSSEKKHKEKTEDSHHNEGPPSSNSVVHKEERFNNDLHHNRTEMTLKARRQSSDSVLSNNQRVEGQPGVASERQGRTSNRNIREKPERRQYSCDRVISNVPVYKTQANKKPLPDRPVHRTQSIDRYMGDKVERRFSADMSANEKLNPRSQRVEKSIIDEFQQRGRTREKPARDTLVRRSQSIDAYSTEVPRPSPLSRQSSYTSQLSRQSSIEHAIVAQSFPLTQRKLLQDPDSGQYFFVDMPVQVKTKTFFDPETGSYVQLPVQPPEGGVPQASPIEVLTPPMVVYHSFVPVPLSPMAQKTTVQAPSMEANEFEQRHQERSRQILCKEGQPYLEPVYTQNDLMLGEFLGTEELDCPR